MTASQRDLHVGAPTIDSVLASLHRLRAPLITQETDLQALVARRLTEDGIPFQREYRWSRSRIDFLIPGGTGIETKKGAPNRTALLRQLERYCKHEAIHQVILIVPWQRHLSLPETVAGKPVHVISLNRLWGIAT